MQLHKCRTNIWVYFPPTGNRITREQHDKGEAEEVSTMKHEERMDGEKEVENPVLSSEAPSSLIFPFTFTSQWPLLCLPYTCRAELEV
jgi:hypothetical protein